MEWFTVWSKKIKGRLDPYYYSRDFVENEMIIQKSGYPVKTLRDISKTIVDGPFGSQLKVEEYVQKGIPLIRVKNVKNEELVEKGFVYITKKKQEQLKRSKVNPNDIVLTKAGSIGNACIFPERLKEANITSHLAKIEVKESITPKYICRYLNTRLGRLQVFREGNKSTRPELNISEVASILVVLPPAEIQHKIITLMDNVYKAKKSKESQAQKLLDSIDAYVLSELWIKLSLLKDYKYFIVEYKNMKSRLDPYYYQPKFGGVERAISRAKFKVKKLKEFITKIHYGASVKNEYVDEGIPLLRILNLKENKFDLTNVVKLPESMRKDLGKAFVNKGDLLISRSGTVGVVAVVPKEADGYAFGSFMIKFCLKKEINKYYVAIWLNSRLQKMLTQREKIGAIQGNITISTIENFNIPFPSLKIQSQIVQEVKKRLADAERLRTEANKTIGQTKQEVEQIILGG